MQGFKLYRGSILLLNFLVYRTNITFNRLKTIIRRINKKNNLVEIAALRKVFKTKDGN